MKFESMINQVIQGDCLEIMRDIPDKSINCIITDPPYGINFKSTRQTYQKHIENDKFEDWLKILPKMLIEFKRVLTDVGCCCCFCGGGKAPVTAIFTIEAIKHFHLIQTLVWRKFIGLGWRYRPAYENIVILSKDKDNYSFYDTSKKCGNVIEGINQDIPTEGEHPTQKPIVLMGRLINIHTKENDLVLDAFCGTGSTLIAAHRLDRKFIGIEINQTYTDIARERIKKETDQMKLAI